MSYSVIGGADGPTSIFVAGKIGTGLWNGYGVIFLILLLIPNILYAAKFKNVENRCTLKWANILEQVGRYTSMFFMVFSIGSLSGGFYSISALFIYILGSAVLLLLYWGIWMLYFIKQSAWKSIVLAVIPVLLFLIGGITMQNIFAVLCAIFFGIGHIFVTVWNIRNV